MFQEICKAKMLRFIYQFKQSKRNKSWRFKKISKKIINRSSSNSNNAKNSERYFENNFWPIEKRMTYAMKILKFYGDQVFLFVRSRLFSFLHGIKRRSSITSETLTEVLQWHSRSKIHKIRKIEIIELKFCRFFIFMN